MILEEVFVVYFKILLRRYPEEKYEKQPTRLRGVKAASSTVRIVGAAFKCHVIIRYRLE
jgi:hypothetical protein